MEGIQDKDYNFLGNDKFPNLYERLLHEGKLKEWIFRETYLPFIENQSEHLSKLSLQQSLVKRKFIPKR